MYCAKENYPLEKLCKGKVICVLNQASLYEDVKREGVIAPLIPNFGTGLRVGTFTPQERALCTFSARVTVFLVKIRRKLREFWTTGAYGTGYT